MHNNAQTTSKSSSSSGNNSSLKSVSDPNQKPSASKTHLNGCGQGSSTSLPLLFTYSKNGSTNNLRRQSLSSAKSSFDLSSSSTHSSQQTPTKDPTASWISSFHKVVSAINLVSKEKNVFEKEEDRKLREKDMYLTRPKICRLPLKTIPELCISLSGCGFLGTYHFGAVDCFLKNGQHVISRLNRVSGASAGSLVASLLLLGPEKLGLALNVLFDLGEELTNLRFGALTPGYCLNDKLLKIVQGFLPQDISPAQGRLFISVTKREERTNRLISQFSSRDDLLKCLMASCFIPLYSMGYGTEPPIIDGQACIDGGYTNNLPDFDDIRTITVSPFSGNAEISPADARNFFDWKMTVCNQTMNVNLKNIVRGAQALFPPSRTVLQNYYDMGYKDTLKFLIKHDIVQRPTGTEV